MKAISKSSPAPELAQGGGYPAQSPQRDEPGRYLFLVPYLQQTRRPKLQRTQALGNLRGSRTAQQNLQQTRRPTLQANRWLGMYANAALERDRRMCGGHQL